MTQFQVTCITKPDRDSHHEAITHLGGPGWYSAVADVIAHIKAKRHEFYVLGPSGKRAIVGWQVSASGREFVQTYSDGQWDNNLLSLRQCS